MRLLCPAFARYREGVGSPTPGPTGSPGGGFSVGILGALAVLAGVISLLVTFVTGPGQHAVPIVVGLIFLVIGAVLLWLGRRGARE